MACSVGGPSPRSRPRLHPRPSRSLDRNMGLDLEPKLSVSASNCVRTASRVSPVLRCCQRIPLSRSPPQPLPPVRPRSPTPRVGRRLARRKPRYQRQESAQCMVQARAVALSNRKTPGRSARRSATAARALGRVPGEHCLPSDAPRLPSLVPRSPSYAVLGTPPRPLRLVSQTSILRITELSHLIPPLSPHHACSTFFPSPPHFPPNFVTASPF